MSVLTLNAAEAHQQALPVAPTAPPTAPRRRLTRPGDEPFVWLTGAGLATAILMIAALIALVLINGAVTFWPRRLTEITLRDGTKLIGEVTRSERYKVQDVAGLPPGARAAIESAGGWSTRRLLRTGNYDLYGDDFKWVDHHDVAAESTPQEAWFVERLEWGPAVGRLEAVTRDGIPVDEAAASAFAALHSAARRNRDRLRTLSRQDAGEINYDLEQLRLNLRRTALLHGKSSAEYQAAAESAAAEESLLGENYRAVQTDIDRITAEDQRLRFVLRESSGRLLPERPGSPDTPLLLSQVVRAYPANSIGLGGRLRVYASRWWEFLTSEPREANTEGGVLPAIFGTFVMTILMSVVVAPCGVIAALYLREYARQGWLVSGVRIAVNNLAGVPSIVFGVFGLGFFCYVLGGTIDQVFFPEKLPAPTYGTGGILWASLTLALLTVPVVIVASEEAFAAVPRSMREGSLACGASKWQTIWRIVLPKAAPGILTGLILAMARGAGEVAPLMITGVVKLAPDLPIDGHFPFFHLERSFMHLGFHIYDVGFQSRNSEAGKPMVFTTTLLLVGLITVLNLVAIRLRSRLMKRYAPAQF